MPVHSPQPGVVGVSELSQRDFVLAGFAIKKFAADFNGALTLMLIEPVFDFVACAGALGKGEPIAAGRVAVLSQDFDDIAVAQTRSQRHHATVHLRAGAGVPDLGVNGIGEVDGSGFFGKDNDLALGVKV